jgi:hypothetical protein
MPKISFLRVYFVIIQSQRDFRTFVLQCFKKGGQGSRSAWPRLKTLSLPIGSLGEGSDPFRAKAPYPPHRPNSYVYLPV